MAACAHGSWSRPACSSSPPGSRAARPARRATPSSPLERKLVDRALAAERLEIDPAPAGKRVRRQLLFTGEVFDDDQPLLEPFNVFTWRTDDDVVLREVLLAPGDAWTKARWSTASGCGPRDEAFRTVVSIFPVRPSDGSIEPGLVDLLVVTRDIWSLQVTTDFQSVQGAVDEVDAQLSEQPLRAQQDPRGGLHARRLHVRPRRHVHRPTHRRLALPHFRRPVGDPRAPTAPSTATAATSSSAGRSTHATSMGLGSLDTSYFVGTRRQTAGAEILLYDAPDTPETEAIERRYHGLRVLGSLTGTRSFGTDVKDEVSFGYGVLVDQFGFPDDFPAVAPEAKQDFEDEVLPEDRTQSFFILGYAHFENRFLELRNFDTFDLAESGGGSGRRSRS